MSGIELDSVVTWFFQVFLKTFLVNLLQSERMDGSDSDGSEFAKGESEEITGPAVAAAVNGVSSPRKRGNLSPRSAAIISGKFFEALTSSDFYKNTKVTAQTFLRSYILYLSML